MVTASSAVHALIAALIALIVVFIVAYLVMLVVGAVYPPARPHKHEVAGGLAVLVALLVFLTNLQA